MFLAHLSLIIKLTVHIFIFFSRTTRPISTRYSTKHPWVIGNQVYSNEGTRLFPREDNNQIAKSIAQIKNFLQNLLVSFKQTWHKVSLGKWMQNCSNEEPRQVQTKLEQSILEWKEFQFLQVKDHAIFQSEIIMK